jgi:biotin-(acetyl-CoA carboxylase) ligase
MLSETDGGNSKAYNIIRSCLPLSVKMQREWHRPMRRADDHALDLPPVFRPRALREAGDSFAYACAHAGDLGAGALIHVGRFDLAECAVVLEPDEPLAAARRVLYAGMVALSDALAGLAPPEKPIAIDWPDAILVDGALVGGGRLGWPDDADEHAVPEWLVLGVMIRTQLPNAVEPGLHPRATALNEEGFEKADPGRVIEGFVRHFLAATDRWQAAGFGVLARGYLSKLRQDHGAALGIDENGDLSLAAPGGLAHWGLRPALAAPSWLDRVTGEPRL